MADLQFHPAAIILEKVDFINAKESNTGYGSAATNTGYEGCAISLGIEGKAQGKNGCWLTLAEWKQSAAGDYHRVDVQTIRVDGIIIKEDVFYQLKNGMFVEAES